LAWAVDGSFIASAQSTAAWSKQLKEACDFLSSNQPPSDQSNEAFNRCFLAVLPGIISDSVADNLMNKAQTVAHAADWATEAAKEMK
jgi:hypothetical protein